MKRYQIHIYVLGIVTVGTMVPAFVEVVVSVVERVEPPSKSVVIPNKDAVSVKFIVGKEDPDT